MLRLELAFKDMISGALYSRKHVQHKQIVKDLASTELQMGLVIILLHD
jgi:hypothetical protein